MSWREETHEHIRKVFGYLGKFAAELLTRREKHDFSKLEDPEAAVFAEYTSKLKGVNDHPLKQVAFG